MLKLASAIFSAGFALGAASVAIAIRRGHWQLVPAADQQNAGPTTATAATSGEVMAPEPAIAVAERLGT